MLFDGRRVLGVLALAVLLVGCSAPVDQYPKLGSDGIYFKVPRTWSEVPEKVLAKFEAKNTDQAALDRLAVVRWQAAYAPGKVSAAQVFSAKPSELPIAYIRVRDMYTEERDSVSLNTLRDAIFPITKWAADPKLAIFIPLLDEEVTFKGAAGVHVTYSFSQNGGAPQVVDQNALLSPDRNTLYLLVVRCSESCYRKNQQAIEAISASLVVRGARG